MTKRILQYILKRIILSLYKDEDELIDMVAQAIYHYSGGLTDEDYIEVFGNPRPLWETAAPWDSNPNEIAEHERDDYRVEARAALKALGLITKVFENERSI